MTDAPEVRLDRESSRFETVTSAGKAVLKFAMAGDTIDLQHTSVPEELQGGGYGSALARAALAYARENHLKVIPTCAFIRSFMQRHKEYDDLRATKS